MNAEVCQALTGEQGSQQVLEALERANLFLIPLDEERRWYRLHTLFREVLLARLQATQPEQVSRLHREAALWYQQQDWPHEAIPHALATQDFGFVAELLEGYTERLFLQGEAQTLLTWIKRLPQAVLRAHPRLATSYILAFNMLYPFSVQQQEEQAYLQQLQEGVEVLLRDHQSTFPEVERDRLRHRLVILDGWELAKKALSDGDEKQLIELAAQVQHLSLDDDLMWQQHRLAPFGMAWRMAGKFPPMVEALQEGRKLIRMTAHRSQEVHLLWGLVAALIALGQLRQAHDYCQELQQLVKQLGEPLPLAAYSYSCKLEIRNAQVRAKAKSSFSLLLMFPNGLIDALFWSFLPRYHSVGKQLLLCFFQDIIIQSRVLGNKLKTREAFHAEICQSAAHLVPATKQLCSV